VRGEEPTEMMGSTADSGRQLTDQRNEGVPPGSTAQNDRAPFIEADQATNILAYVGTKHRNSHDRLFQ
jgi:hypothetical protein